MGKKDDDRVYIVTHRDANTKEDKISSRRDNYNNFQDNRFNRDEAVKEASKHAKSGATAVIWHPMILVEPGEPKVMRVHLDEDDA